MSHIHVPRVCVDGAFQAGGVTANNVLAAREEVNTPSFKPPPADRNWHNNNLASNQFSVRSAPGGVSAWDEDGPVTSDPVLGATISGDGVMADLDPEHRRVTDLFGFELAVGLAPEQAPLLGGTLRTTQLRDYWQWPVQDQPVFLVSTAWQSVLGNLTWSPDVGRSKVLSRLREVSGDALSVRLALTRFDGRGGKLIVAIGPHAGGEPEQIAPGRRLTSDGGAEPYVGFPTASFLVDQRRQKLAVDLGSLIPRSPDRKASLLTGLTAEVGGAAIGKPRDLTVGEWLKSAGLVEWDLTPTVQKLLVDKPLRLEFTQDGAAKPSILNEHPEGKYVDVDRRSLRLNPGETGTVAVYARQFGRPLSDEVVRFNLERQRAGDPIRSLRIQKGDPYYPPDPDAKINGEPADVFDPAPPFWVKTDAKGRAVLSLNVKPGPFTFPPERKAIDSQLYFLGDPGCWQRWGALGPEVGAGCALSVLVFNTGTVPAKPTWDDVSPILARYARLYPLMKQVLDLADQATVQSNAFRIRKRIKALIDAVEYMPVTRDLSAHDRALIVKYLDAVIATHKGGQEAR